jgi:hypothetical protein
MAYVIADAGNSIMYSHKLPHLMPQSPHVLFNNPS